ncbi:hypothetical protein [Parabacteroides chinchillae]|uniref:Uncharacterized protein n=1 Tax=Parabacteroides chinchillae TaxID=871327 RepID=A0A8G2BTZ0_9BACT|nr:hypothetical protein [Parabacteroides chinchillae]SEF40279.1 hypothetical protein SAMN05444001_10127 [Parabacteroides chinchillae]
MKRGSKIDEILTLLFMLLAIAAVICYFAVNDRSVFLYCGGAAIVLRLAQYVVRFIN